MKHVIIRGNNHYYEDRNPNGKEAILLVHGHPFDHTMWRYQYDTLSGFRLILPDLKGYGKTDFAFDKIFIEEQALDLALLLDELQVNAAHLMGLSMGGQIIVEFTRLFPHRVKSLVICDSNPSGETERSYKQRLELAGRMQSAGMENYTKQDIHKYLHPDTINTNKAAYDHLYKMMVNTRIEGAVAAHRGRAERRDNYPFLKNIRVPALVVVGDRDFFTPVGEMEAIAGQIPGASFAVINDAGHMPNMEQPEVFNTLLAEFYNSHGFAAG